MQQQSPQCGVDFTVLNRCKSYSLFSGDMKGEVIFMWLCTCSKGTEAEAHNLYHLTVTIRSNYLYQLDATFVDALDLILYCFFWLNCFEL